MAFRIAHREDMGVLVVTVIDEFTGYEVRALQERLDEEVLELGWRGVVVDLRGILPRLSSGELEAAREREPGLSFSVPFVRVAVVADNPTTRAMVREYQALREGSPERNFALATFRSLREATAWARDANDRITPQEFAAGD